MFQSSEKLGPTDEDEADFEKELAKMVTESATESRKLDKRTAQALWDSAVLSTAFRKKKGEDDTANGDADDVDSNGQETMKFMLLTKKGNKQQVRLVLATGNSLPHHML